MNRTTIMLPESLKVKAIRVAAKRHVSLGELIREGLKKVCENNQPKERDIFFTDSHVFTGDTPKDLAKNHDDYLY